MSSMKLRGMLGGLGIFIEPNDTEVTIRSGLASKRDILCAAIQIEWTGKLPGGLLEALVQEIQLAGGTIKALLGHSETPSLPETAAGSDSAEIVRQSLRSGTRFECKGSVVVLGDVHSGAEILAGGDVIVWGALRGVVHAGGYGNLDAVVVGCPIVSPIIKIADVVANDPEREGLNSMKLHADTEAQMARLSNGQIVIQRLIQRAQWQML